MKETKIKILATNETFPVSEFTFWLDGKATHHQIESPYHAPYDSTTLYESGTWELVEEDIFIQPMTYERSLEIEELEMQVRERVRNEVDAEGYGENGFDMEAYYKRWDNLEKSIRKELGLI